MAKEYLRRFAIVCGGFALYGLGNACGVHAGSAGTNAWSTLNLGLCNLFGFSFGTASFLVSLLVIILDLVGKGKIGFATLLNVLIISVFSDFWIKLLNLLPPPASTAGGVVLTLFAQFVISFCTVLYMSAALGCGPRDTLMVIIGKKFPKLPIGAVKFGIEVFVVTVGVLLGAPFGVGTVLIMALQASIFQLVCRICRFEPRSVVHEDIPETVRRIRGGKGT